MEMNKLKQANQLLEMVRELGNFYTKLQSGQSIRMNDEDSTSYYSISVNDHPILGIGDERYGMYESIAKSTLQNENGHEITKEGGDKPWIWIR